MTGSVVQLDREVIARIVASVVAFVAPKRVILFGSRARGTANRYSDYDLAVEGATMGIREERLLKEALDRELGIVSCDLVDLDKVDPEFRRLVVSEGVVVYEA